jgi:hypothetical protein
MRCAACACGGDRAAGGYSQSQGAVRFRSQEVGGSLAGRDPLRFWGWSGQARRRGGGLVATAAGASHCVMPVGKHERVVATALRGKKKIELQLSCVHSRKLKYTEILYFVRIQQFPSQFSDPRFRTFYLRDVWIPSF